MSTPQLQSAPVTLVSPFPWEHRFPAWGWLLQFPDNNFDDYGQQEFDTFARELKRRFLAERTWLALRDGQPCGIIGYLPITPRMGSFHGIAFDEAVHGDGTAKAAVSMVIQELFGSGVEKICASFFFENERVFNFLSGLGARTEGILRKHTLCHGVPIDMRQVAIFRDTFIFHGQP